jgi:UDP-N-acetylmuramoylalanine--D-glutamate ligase
MTTPLTHVRGRRYAVFGLARSGIATAKALLAGGADVACWDDGTASREAAAKDGLPLIDLTTADWSNFQSLVLAPGVPLTHPVPHWTVGKAKAAGVEIIGDIELFFRERAAVCPDATVVAITGTNGKSTTTALIAHILRAAGRDVAMGGNIGVGVLALPPPAKDRIHVLELSSFQIDLTPTLNPSVGVLLNITPDHLDRHGTMENYAAIKARVAEGAECAVIGVENAYDKEFVGMIRRDLYKAGKPVATFSRNFPRVAGIMYHRDGSLMRAIHYDHGTYNMVTETLSNLSGVSTLRGSHNMENAAAAFLACEWLQVPHDEIGAAMKTFPGLPHRMEQIGRVGRALLINDSKATNADSTEKALASFPRDIFWIAGGVQKEGGIAPLSSYFDRVAKAYLIGKSSPDFAATLDGNVRYEICATLDAALAAAVRDAAASSAAEPVVLLSPACASYDQYKSFEHRGDHFRTLAQALPGFVT